jgi:hypothetical protein
MQRRRVAAALPEMPSRLRLAVARARPPGRWRFRIEAWPPLCRPASGSSRPPTRPRLEPKGGPRPACRRRTRCARSRRRPSCSARCPTRWRSRRGPGRSPRTRCKQSARWMAFIASRWSRKRRCTRKTAAEDGVPSRRRERRCYECEQCKGWHLTSWVDALTPPEREPAGGTSPPTACAPGSHQS